MEKTEEEKRMEVLDQIAGAMERIVDGVEGLVEGQRELIEGQGELVVEQRLMGLGLEVLIQKMDEKEQRQRMVAEKGVGMETDEEDEDEEEETDREEDGENGSLLPPKNIMYHNMEHGDRDHQTEEHKSFHQSG